MAVPLAWVLAKIKAILPWIILIAVAATLMYCDFGLWFPKYPS